MFSYKHLLYLLLIGSRFAGVGAIIEKLGLKRKKVRTIYEKFGAISHAVVNTLLYIFL